MPEQYAPGNTPPAIVEDWAFLGHLTVQQDERLKEFRRMLLEHANTKDNLGKANDLELLRFLRAREFNLKKAMKMVLDDVEWRREVAGRKLSFQTFPRIAAFAKNRLVRLAGKDKDGRPVLVLRSGEMFPRKVPDIMEVVNFFIFYVEHLKKYVDSLGFSEFVAIADMKGWSLSENFSLPVSQILAQMLQDHYPETLRYAFVINNPFAFSAAWSLISPFLEDRVKAKVHVWGKKMERLLDYIPAANLEKEFGGDRDPYPVPDEIVQPLFDHKTAMVGPKPYEHIQWIGDESSLPSSPASSASVGLKSPKSGDEGFSDYEEDDEDAKVVSQVSSLNVETKGSVVGGPAQPEKKKKKKGFRATIGRMFSSKAKKGFQSESESVDGDLPGPQMPMSPTGKEDRPMEVVPAKPRPRIAVFGATGKTGRALVLDLMEKNNDVTAFVRVNGSKLAPELVQKAENSQDIKRPRLNIVVGEVSNLLDMERVVEDCDAVICAMGVIPAISGVSCDFLPDAISHIMDAMEKLKVRRIVVVSSAHASQSWSEQGAGLMSNLTKPIYWKNHYQYVAKMEDEVKTRGAKGVVDFTIVRPGNLIDGPISSGIRCEEGFVFPDTGPGEVTRADLVKFLITEALDTKAVSPYVGRGVAIGRA